MIGLIHLKVRNTPDYIIAIVVVIIICGFKDMVAVLYVCVFQLVKKIEVWTFGDLKHVALCLLNVNVVCVCWKCFDGFLATYAIRKTCFWLYLVCV